MSEVTVVGIEMHGPVAVVVIASPPVNALSWAVRSALLTNIGIALNDSLVHAIVITGAQGCFVAGGDIGEFGTIEREPTAHSICDLIEAATKPIIAAVEGVALGGGLELAMGCHWRVAQRAARLALPEVKLGILPGAGGTKRLPRLVGVPAALRMTLSGAFVMAEAAVALGLIDEVVDGAVLPHAVALARRIIEAGAPIRRTMDRNSKLASARRNPQRFERVAVRLLAAQAGQAAPQAIVDSLRDSFTLSHIDGHERDQQRLADLITGPQCRALSALFFAERQAARIDGVAKPARLGVAAWNGERARPSWLRASNGEAPDVVFAPANGLTAVPGDPTIAVIGSGAAIHRTLEARPPGRRMVGLHVTRVPGAAMVAEISRRRDDDPREAAALLGWARSNGMIAIGIVTAPTSPSRKLALAARRASSGLADRGIGRDAQRAALRAFGFPSWATLRLTASVAAASASAMPGVDPCAHILAAIATAARELLASGCIARPGDVDVLCVAALGWPRWRAGPLSLD